MTEDSDREFNEDQAADQTEQTNGQTGSQTAEEDYYARSTTAGAEAEPEEEGMNFLDHLEELRWRLIKSLVGVVAVGIIGYLFSDQLLQVFLFPARNVNTPFNLQVLGVPDMLMVKIKIGIFTGIVGALPIITFQMWRFIAPGLLPHEKQYVPSTVTVVTLCFLIGGTFGYFVILPVALEFLSGLGLTTIQNNYALDKYVSFVTRIILITGLIFELPVLSFFLTKIGLVTPAVLRHIRRYAVIITFVGAAFITPPDPASMVLMGIPILLLYEISIWVSYFGLPPETRQELRKAKKRRKQEQKRRKAGG